MGVMIEALPGPVPRSIKLSLTCDGEAHGVEVDGSRYWSAISAPGQGYIELRDAAQKDGWHIGALTFCASCFKHRPRERRTADTEPED